MMNLKSLSLVLVVLAISGHEVKGWKMMTALNGWMKTACIAENIKENEHYICDKNGKMRCMPGYTNEMNYCRDPICNPPCKEGQGNCTKPNCCTCEVGWSGVDCSKCVCLPGCKNGDCHLPFQCNCHPGWHGMLCNKPVCREGCVNGDCSMPGECNCFPGWTGPNCTECIKLPGCSDYGYCTKPLECKCHRGYEGNFCQKPKCRAGCNTTTGFCTKPNECWCLPGWTGPRCEDCVPYPGCKNGGCVKPWECVCNNGYTGMLCDQDGGSSTTSSPYIPYGNPGLIPDGPPAPPFVHDTDETRASEQDGQFIHFFAGQIQDPPSDEASRKIDSSFSSPDATPLFEAALLLNQTFKNGVHVVNETGRTTHLRGNQSQNATDQVASFVLNNGPPVIPSDVIDSKLFTKDVKKNEEINQSTSSTTNRPAVSEVSRRPSTESHPDTILITNLQQLLSPSQPSPAIARPKSPRFLDSVQNSDLSQLRIQDQNNSLPDPILTSELQSNKVVVTETPVLPNNQPVSSSTPQNSDAAILIPKNEIINPTFLASNPQFISPLESAINAVVSKSQPEINNHQPTNTISPIQSQPSINNFQNPAEIQTNDPPATAQPAIPNNVLSNFEQFLNIPSIPLDQTQIKNQDTVSLGQPSENVQLNLPSIKIQDLPAIPNIDQNIPIKLEITATPSSNGDSILPPNSQISRPNNPDILGTESTPVNLNTGFAVGNQPLNNQPNPQLVSQNDNSNRLTDSNHQLTDQNDQNIRLPQPPLTNLATLDTKISQSNENVNILIKEDLPKQLTSNTDTFPSQSNNPQINVQLSIPSDSSLTIQSMSNSPSLPPQIITQVTNTPNLDETKDVLEQTFIPNLPSPIEERERGIATKIKTGLNFSPPLQRQLPAESQSDFERQLSVHHQPDVERHLPVIPRPDLEKQLPVNPSSDLEKQLPVNPQVTISNPETTTSRSLGIFNDVPEGDQLPSILNQEPGSPETRPVRIFSR